MDYGVDSNRTFGLKELIVFTDFLEVPQTRFTRQCNILEGSFPCLVSGKLSYANYFELLTDEICAKARKVNNHVFNFRVL